MNARISTYLKTQNYKILRVIIILLITIGSKNKAFGQFPKFDSIPLYFPKSAFISGNTFDTIANRYWSSYLFGLKKEIIYDNPSVKECYRLIYYGPCPLVVEIFKRGDSYIIISDSLPDRNKWYRRYDSISATDFIQKMPDLGKLDLYFWDKKNQTYFSSNSDTLFILDDRDAWLIEAKKGNKYNVVSTIEPEQDLKDFIVHIMTVSKHGGFRIYTSMDKYDSF